MPSSTNESDSPDHRYSLVSGLSMASVSGPGQEEGEEREEEEREDERCRVQWEERIHSATTLCPDQAEPPTLRAQHTASASEVGQSQSVLEAEVGSRVQLEVPGDRSLSMAVETLPLASGEVDNLGEVEECLNSTLLEASEMPGRRVRLALLNGVVSVCGEMGEQLLRWSLKTTADCIQVSTPSHQGGGGGGEWRVEEGEVLQFGALSPPPPPPPLQGPT